MSVGDSAQPEDQLPAWQNYIVNGTLGSVGRLVLHVCFGIVLFLTLGFAVFVLHIFCEWLYAQGISVTIIFTITILEYLLFFLDTLCCVVFCSAETYMFIQHISISAGWIKLRRK
jgi:hypothetical protein